MKQLAQNKEPRQVPRLFVDCLLDELLVAARPLLRGCRNGGSCRPPIRQLVVSEQKRRVAALVGARWLEFVGWGQLREVATSERHAEYYSLSAVPTDAGVACVVHT